MSLSLCPRWQNKMYLIVYLICFDLKQINPNITTMMEQQIINGVTYHPNDGVTH